MKFLEEIYISELNNPDLSLVSIEIDTDANGNHYQSVIIDGKIFPPIDILKNVEPDTFTQAFEDWKERKEDELLERVENILKYKDNRDRFNQLEQIYRRNAVIPFIGAGMSSPTGYLKWEDFLYYLQENSTIEYTLIKDKITNGEFEEAAQILYDDMSGPIFNELLSNTYGTDKVIQGPVNFIPYLFNSAVITTNFDPVLKTLYDNTSNSFEEVINGSNAESFTANLGAGKRTLLKLHGDFGNEKERILTLNEYQKAYDDESIINTLIEDAFFNRTLLFLGCSLTQDRTIKKMEEYVRLKGHVRCVKHYCFLECPDTEPRRLEIRNRLSKSNIFPIWYPKEQHNESIEALLFKLKGSF